MSSFNVVHCSWIKSGIFAFWIFVRPDPSPETLVVVRTPTFAAPCTSSLYMGASVPIPTLPVSNLTSVPFTGSHGPFTSCKEVAVT